MTPNRTSRHTIPTKKNAGGTSATNGVASASQAERRPARKASMPKAGQYRLAVSRNILAEPGAIGSMSRQSTAIAGDCQSPNRQAMASA